MTGDHNQASGSGYLQSSLGKARNNGSAKSGTGHWIHQRISAIALILLGPWFLYSVLTETVTTYDGILAWLDNPGDLVLLALTVCVALYHGFLGLQIVIEDYVHTPWVKFSSLVIIKFAFIVLGVMAVYAIVSVKFLDQSSLDFGTESGSRDMVQQTQIQTHSKNQTQTTNSQNVVEAR